MPGNNVCADCQARNPGWASWSLGIFLCMRCAAIHRKLGTHISKVKSLSMDTWSNEQVEAMKRNGNVASNRIYNPQNTRPPIPIDVDEADSAMERFIRQKYQGRSGRTPVRNNNTGSTNSDDTPPPLPPKTGSRFGFRSASSIFPLSSKAKRDAKQQDFDYSGERSPPLSLNKQSRVFGSDLGTGADDELETKMAKLREMGFMDDKRNLAVLKGLSGNLERAIETLARLGEGNGVAQLPRSSNSSGPSSRARTPISPTAGLTISRLRDKELPTPSSQSSNPFDMLDNPPPIAQPQSSQSTGSLPHLPTQIAANNPFQPTSNPFGLMPSQSQTNLNQAFQSMAISPSQPQQPLFPNHTGGYSGPQPSTQQQLYQQSMTPPVPSIPQQYYPPIYENPQQQLQQNYNPFMAQQQAQTQPRQPAPINTNFQSNPFMQQQQGQSLYQQSPMQQSPQQFRSISAFHSHQNHPQPQSNPFLQNNQAQFQTQAQLQNIQPQSAVDYPPQQQFPAPTRQQTFPLIPQQPQRADNRTILDLYNFPQVAPTAQEAGYQQLQQPQVDATPAQYQVPTAQQQQPRSVSSPLTTQTKNPFMLNGSGMQSPGGSHNPFPVAQNTTAFPQGPNGTNPFPQSENTNPFPPVSNGANPFPEAQNGTRHVSNESVSIDVGGWQNGRHSPDAWGTISARSMR